MHFDEQLLASMTEAELDDTLNWVRTREKNYRRNGAYGLEYFWRAMGLDVVAEFGRRYATQPHAHIEQLTLDAPGRIEPELRGFPDGWQPPLA